MENKDRNSYNIKRYLKSQYKKDKDSKKLILKTLELLYPGRGDFPDISIQNPQRFQRYFANTIFTTEFPEKEFLKISTSSIEDLKNLLDLWQEKKWLFDLRTKIWEKRFFISKVEFENVVLAWIYIINNDPRSNNEILIQNLIPKNTTQIIKERYDKDQVEFKKFLYSLFDTSNKIYFENTIIIRDLLRHYIDEPDFEFILTKGELLKLAITRLEEQVKLSQKFNNMDLEFYYNCYEDILADSRNVIIPIQANEILRNKIIKDPSGYLKFSVRPKYIPHDDKTYVFEPFIPQYFESWDNFKNFLMLQINENEKIKPLARHYIAFSENNHEWFTSTDLPINLILNEVGEVGYKDL